MSDSWFRDIITETERDSLVVGAFRFEPSDAALVKDLYGKGFEKYRSALVFGLSYNRQIPSFPEGEPRGVFSVMACGEDYHSALFGIITSVAELLDKQARYERFIHIDKGKLPEQDFFVRAGLGFKGRNNLVINDRLGSFFNIGLMLTTLDYPGGDNERKFTDARECKECRLCEAACPAEALSPTYNRAKCISYLTQKKGVLTDEERRLTGNALYGCDACQLICPYNTHAYKGGAVAVNEIYPLLSDIQELNGEGFRRGYEHRACYWRGLELLKRNAGYAQIAHRTG